jgi:hypothetical protein
MQFSATFPSDFECKTLRIQKVELARIEAPVRELSSRDDASDDREERHTREAQSVARASQ